MGKVTQIYESPVVRRDIAEACNELDVTIGEAVMEAKNAGVPQGLIVAIIHAHDHAETSQIWEMQDDDT
jgi:hypothetical protein